MKKVIKTIRDPIYGDIKIFHPTLIALINTQEFNRLRSIFQTPSVSPVFPGATSTRFLHCLGTLYLAQKILESDTFVNNVSETDKLKVKIACLLHDIGHGPLSHTFEEINAIQPGLFHHEQIARRFLTDPTSEIQAVLKQQFNNNRDIEDIIDMINGTSQHPLAVLVNSQADTDRMDYLMRDNWFAGTGYGYVDSQFLVRNIGFDFRTEKIYFLDKAVFSLENYLIGRYHMHTQVYNHPTSRGFNMLFRSIMLRIFDLWEQKFQFVNKQVHILIEVFKKRIKYQHLLQLDDYFLISFLRHLSQEKDPILKTLSYAWNKKLFFSEVKVLNRQLVTSIKNKFGRKGLKYFLITIVKQTNKSLIYDHKNQKPILIKNSKTHVITPISQVSKLINILTKVSFSNNHAPMKLIFMLDHRSLYNID